MFDDCMPISESFTQCVMRNGTSETTGYIPSRAARVGNKIELPDFDGGFWEVISLGHKMHKAAVQSQSRNYKGFQGSTKGGGID